MKLDVIKISALTNRPLTPNSHHRTLRSKPAPRNPHPESRHPYPHPQLQPPNPRPLNMLRAPTLQQVVTSGLSAGCEPPTFQQVVIKLSDVDFLTKMESSTPIEKPLVKASTLTPETFSSSFSLFISSVELSDTRVYKLQIRALLGTASRFGEVVVLKLRTFVR